MSLPSLADALTTVARLPRILVATDFDGTLAEIVDDPTDARVPASVIRTLAGLAACQGVACHVVSGRALANLRFRLDGAEGVHLWGSYGAETERGSFRADAHDLTHLVEAIARLKPLLAAFPGTKLEEKPLSVAFHTRQLSPEDAVRAEDAARDLMAASPLHGTLGKRVIEWCVTVPDKAAVVKHERAAHQADAVIYLGDDHSDEWIFRVADPQDVSIKVGEGPTVAPWRVDNVAQARATLHTLLTLRS